MKVSTLFILLTCVGCWRPTSWSTPLKIVIYSVYTLFFVGLSCVFVTTAITKMFDVEDVDEFVDNTYLLVALFVGCCKVLNVLAYRKKILNLVDTFLEEPCVASNTEEAQIQLIYDNRIWFVRSTRKSSIFSSIDEEYFRRKYAIHYTIMMETTVGLIIFNSYTTNFQHRRLTYTTWVPYECKTFLIFTLTFTLQMIYLLMQSLVHAASDVLFVGVLLQICCQFDILLSRLSRISTSGKSNLQKLIRHHNCIYQLAEMTNSTLHLIIFSQFFGSFLVFCLSMVQLLNMDIVSTQFLATISYLGAILVQNFIYCWFGNKVKLKSTDLSNAIFQSDWTDLTESTKKILLIVMSRTRSPIELDSAHVITVDLNFFMTVCDVVYTLFSMKLVTPVAELKLSMII
ncbi:unnamed protein product [Xylocopa violacea]|uniref:Odorant receptor n=1 Tax=Xylocopa violacea TaxID=135666 RepID=A0ABP1PBJ6_XYLVO